MTQDHMTKYLSREVVFSKR